MLITLSPAKSLDFETNYPSLHKTTPIFYTQTKNLVADLQKLGAEEIAEIMSISKKLAELNFERYQNFFNAQTRQALLAFDGDVYEGIDKANLTLDDLNFAQNVIIILSGLYGILRPLDAISPHRLEMGTDFKKINFLAKNLYQFWGDKITLEINKYDSKYLINLASNEYFKSINRNLCNKKIIDIIFKEKIANDFKIIGIHAKRARGLMANFIIKNKITNPEDLKNFNGEKYKFCASLSTSNQLIFTR